MKPICPDCNSEYLDMGKDGSILCHGCKTIFEMMNKGTHRAVPIVMLDSFEGMMNVEQ
jgi:hypothetical protein